MMFHLKFISVVTALVLTVGLIYATDGEHLSLFNSLLLNPSKPPKPKKPRYVAKKTVSKKPLNDRDYMVSPREDYTFFETLSDPGMEKQVGLKRKLSITAGYERTELSSKQNKGSLKGVSLSALNENLARNSRESLDSKGKGYYLVQAASFKRFDHSSELARKLKEKGFDAFIKRYTLNDGKDLRYRVYLGKLEDKTEAVKVLEQGRRFNLEPIIVYQK